MDHRRGFFASERFEFAKRLEAASPRIRKELESVLLNRLFEPWHEYMLYDQEWDVFGFIFFGRRFERNCGLCPETSAALDGIQGVVNAGFSRLGPNTKIRPHVGYTERVLRCHLGLIVPDSTQCGLRVGAETRTWTVNQCLVFDDTVEHEAWNHSGEARVVLLVDVERA